MKNKDVEELLDCGGVLIGSRALGVETNGSDYDIAILEELLPIKYKTMPTRQVEFYFRIAPPEQGLGLIKLDGLDIIVCPKLQHLLDIKEVFEELKLLPKGYISDKHLRIELFHRGLQLRGWSINDFY